MKISFIKYNKLPKSRDWTRSDSSPLGSLVRDNNGGEKTGNEVQRRHRDASQNKEMWMKHANSLKRKYPDGWQPKNKLSRGAMIGIKELHEFNSVEFSVDSLSKRFKRSPESIRRILKSKWVPSEERASKQNERVAERAERRRCGESHSSARESTPNNTTSNSSFNSNLKQIESYLRNKNVS